MRKHILQSQVSPPDAREIPVTSVATVFTTSEAADHPIDHAFNFPRGPGGTRWIADEAGEQTIILVFDSPQTIRQVSLEVEEKDVDRTLLRENLKLTIEQPIRKAQSFHEAVEGWREAGRRSRLNAAKRDQP